MRQIFLIINVIVIIFCFTACSKVDEELQESRQQYAQNVVKFRSNQLKLLVGGTRSDDALSDIGLKSIIDTLNVNTKRFVLDNLDIIKDFTPVVISQDSLDLLSIDADAMLEYLNHNFSETFVKEFLDIVIYNGSLSCTQLNSLNPFESLMIVNAEIYQDLEEIYISQYAIMDNESKREKAIKLCENEYQTQLANCDLASAFVYVIGGGLFALASAFSDGSIPLSVALTSSAAIDTFFSLESLGVNYGCKKKAHDNYVNCLKRIK